jgi:hypothetical protein
LSGSLPFCPWSRWHRLHWVVDRDYLVNSGNLFPDGLDPEC